jgi:formylglycine-generating enzyme required for sulfatase activity
VSATEITQQQYLAVMDDNPSWHRGAAYPDWATRPVEHVTLYEAIAFCNELSERLGLTPYYSYSSELRDPGGSVIMGMTDLSIDRDATGYRLPSPGEWEYVCRAGTTTDFYTGDLVGDGKSCTVSEPAAERAGWFCSNTRDGAHPQGETKSVAQKEANALGIYDIHGNVWEWCYDASAMTAGDIVRGGSWVNTPFDAKSSATVVETWTSPCDGGTRYMNVGFRIVREL